jgi:sulfofructose kinase
VNAFGHPPHFPPEESFKLDVLCVGHAAFDIVLTVDRHPGPDEKCAASSMIFCGGGPAANASVTVARLGGGSAFLGYLGTDPFGSRHHDELTRESVRVDWVVRGGHPTPVSAILVKPDGSRTIVNHKTQTPWIVPEQLDLSNCSPNVVLLDGHEPLVSSTVLRHAAALGAKTVLDAGSLHRGTLELLSSVDFVIASRRFATDFASNEDPIAALLQLIRHAAWAAVTLGSEGVAWCENGTVQRLRAHRVKALDTTGAGDVFHGAFALSIARGAAVTQALSFANAAAALACTRLGARPGIPTEKEVTALLARHYSRKEDPMVTGET